MKFILTVLIFGVTSAQQLSNLKITMITRKLDGDEIVKDSQSPLNCIRYGAICTYTGENGRCRSCKCPGNGTLISRNAANDDLKCLDGQDSCTIFLKDFPQNKPSLPVVQVTKDSQKIGRLVTSDNRPVARKCMMSRVEYFENGSWKSKYKFTFGLKADDSYVLVYLKDYSQMDDLNGSVMKLDIKCTGGVNLCVKFKFAGRKIYTIDNGKVKVVKQSDITTPTLPTTSPTKPITTTIPVTTTTTKTTLRPTTLETTTTMMTKISSTSNKLTTLFPTKFTAMTTEPQISSSKTEKLTTFISKTTQYTVKEDSTYTTHIVEQTIQEEGSRQMYYIVIIILVTVIIIIISVISTFFLIRRNRRLKGGPIGRTKKTNKQKKLSLAALITSSKQKKEKSKQRACSTLSNSYSEDYQQLSAINLGNQFDIYHNLERQKKQSNPYIDPELINKIDLTKDKQKKKKRNNNEKDNKDGKYEILEKRKTVNQNAYTKYNIPTYLPVLDEKPGDEMYNAINEKSPSKAADKEIDQPLYREIYGDYPASKQPLYRELYSTNDYLTAEQPVYGEVYETSQIKPSNKTPNTKPLPKNELSIPNIYSPLEKSVLNENLYGQLQVVNNKNSGSDKNTSQYKELDTSGSNKVSDYECLTNQ